LHELARYDDAVADYKAALALEPGDIAGYKNCGNTLIEAKRLDEALVFYKKTLELDPQYQQRKVCITPSQTLTTRMQSATLKIYETNQSLSQRL